MVYGGNLSFDFSPHFFFFQTCPSCSIVIINYWLKLLCIAGLSRHNPRVPKTRPDPETRMYGHNVTEQ
jgi:hypothetical protein